MMEAPLAMSALYRWQNLRYKGGDITIGSHTFRLDSDGRFPAVLPHEVEVLLFKYQHEMPKAGYERVALNSVAAYAQKLLRLREQHTNAKSVTLDARTQLQMAIEQERLCLEAINAVEADQKRYDELATQIQQQAVQSPAEVKTEPVKTKVR